MITNQTILREFNQLLKKKTFKSEDERTRFIERLGDDFNAIPNKDPLTPAGKAQELVDNSKYLLDSEGVLLAQKALTIDPNCIDAFDYLGEVEKNDSKAITYYKKGIAIGRKELGDDFFKENRGLFCSIPETRTFMSCLTGYAATLALLGRFSEAVQIYEQILTLDIKDHHSVRHPLMLYLIKINDFKKFKKYEKRFINDDMIYQIFNRVLFYFKTTGDSKITNDLLCEAISENKHIVPVLISITPQKRFPDLDDKELVWAFMYSVIAKDFWIDTKGALNWLRKKDIT